MALVAPSAPPASAPLFSTPPSTSDPANFDARADVMFGNLPAFQTAENSLGAYVSSTAGQVYANAQDVVTNAASAAANATLVAGYAGAAVWVTASNYAVNDVKRSPLDGRIYLCWTTATGRTADPRADPAYWRLVGTERPLIVVAGTTVTCVAGFDYVLTNVAATTATLPAAPTSGDPGIRFWLANGLPTNVIARNGQTIMESATDMTYDVPFSNPTFRFVNGTWRFTP